MATPFLIDRVTIIGLGLIGSSIAKAIRKNKIAEIIVGCDTNDVSLTYARSSKMIDVGMNDLATAASDSDIVILSVPPLEMESVASKIAPGLRDGAIVMDTASVKEPIMQAISRHIPSNVDYIPAHPVAGRELNGIRAGSEEMFKGKRVIVTPNEPLENEALKTVTKFWGAMGAKLEGVPPDLHDIIYAHVSHLPHLLAFAMKPIISGDKENKTLKSFLRLQESDANLWAQIFALNKANLIGALDRYLDALWHIKGELSQAPFEEKSGQDNEYALTVLFPRIASSCLITTTMETENKLGFPFSRFTGSGFADFTSPATADPEGDIEQISNHYLPMLSIIQEYISELKKLRDVLEKGNETTIAKAL